MHDGPSGIFKTTSSWDKALPELPCSPVPAKTIVNASPANNFPSFSDEFYPESRSASQSSAPGSLLELKDLVNDMLWILKTKATVSRMVRKYLLDMMYQC